MTEEAKNRMEHVSRLLSSLKNIKAEQEKFIEHLAKMQLELQASQDVEVTAKIAEMFSAESKSHDALKKIIGHLEMELNQLRSQ